jgi:hypothetical protein
MDLENDQIQGSKFLVTYSNIESNSSITIGQKEAWCVEWDMPTLYEPQNNVELYKTEGTDYWKEINYLLCQEEQLKIQHPDLGWLEMQVVNWTLVKYKDFEIDKIPEYQALRRYYEDGEYLFDVELSKQLLNM